MKERVAGNYFWSLCVNTHPSFVSPPSLMCLLKACQRARSHSSLGSLSPEQFEAARRVGSCDCVSTEGGGVQPAIRGGTTPRRYHAVSSESVRGGVLRPSPRSQPTELQMNGRLAPRSPPTQLQMSERTRNPPTLLEALAGR